MPPRRTRQVRPTADELNNAETAVGAPGDVLGDPVPEAFAATTPAKRRARRVQAATSDPKVRLPEGERAVEVADGVMTAPIAGRKFRLADAIGLMSLMEFAVSVVDVDVTNNGQLASFYFVLKDLVNEDEWKDFCRYTREQKCSDTEFIAFQNAAIEAMAARPTAAPATS